jgi:hypothetical protein
MCSYLIRDIEHIYLLAWLFLGMMKDTIKQELVMIELISYHVMKKIEMQKRVDKLKTRNITYNILIMVGNFFLKKKKQWLGTCITRVA